MSVYSLQFTVYSRKLLNVIIWLLVTLACQLRLPGQAGYWLLSGICFAEERFFDPSTTLRVNGESFDVAQDASKDAELVEARSRTIEIKAKKFVYTPHIIKVNKGDSVKIRLISEDVHHGLFLDGYGIQTSAYPGQEGSLSFITNKTGRFSFRCSVTCGEFHPYMIGYLIVEPNSRFHGYVFLTLFIGLASFLVLIFRRRA